MANISVMGFQIEYPVLNLELSRNEKEFDRGIIAIYVAELEKGFIVKKINKPTRKGTKVTYEACKNGEEAEKYIKKVNSLIDEYEKKYNTNLGFKLGSKY